MALMSIETISCQEPASGSHFIGRQGTQKSYI
jgi:hypothetical protein